MQFDEIPLFSFFARIFLLTANDNYNKMILRTFNMDFTNNDVHFSEAFCKSKKSVRHFLFYPTQPPAG
jgi:hypothetical protein